MDMHIFPYISSSSGSTVTGTVVGTGQVMPEGVKDIQASLMWNSSYKGSGVVIAVLDTGCYNHPDLQGQIIGGRNFTSDYNGDPTNYSDNNFHGTHVAGTIAAVSNSTGVIGVAPDVKLLIVKVLDSKGSGLISNIINGIDYATNWRGPNGERVRIMNMSFGALYQTDALYNAVKRAIDANICVVAASGNVGDGDGTTNEVNYPAYYDEVIAVGSYDLMGHVSSFSNSNNLLDLVAPGEGIYSTDNKGGYTSSSGTSMAAPHVSAALALIANKLDAAYGTEATNDELYNYLIEQCTIPLEDATNLQGYGLLRMIHASDAVPTRQIKISDISLDDVLAWYQSIGSMNSPDYWKSHLVTGGTVNPDYVKEQFIKNYIVLALRGIPTK